MHPATHTRLPRYVRGMSVQRPRSRETQMMGVLRRFAALKI
jgi:hypothetical protein